MAFNFNSNAGSSQYATLNAGAAFSFARANNHDQSSPPTSAFDILEWYPSFQSCHRYFLDHAQHSSAVQALAAFVNIQLPYQKMPFPVMSSMSNSLHAGPQSAMAAHLGQPAPPFQGGQASAQAQGVSVVPYLRRLIATGHDSPGVLHGFFGDDWRKGIGPLHEIQRRNYLFAAKSESWAKVKETYDMSADESVPFLSPLRTATEEEIMAAEQSWSEWLLMQDWMMGPRAPAPDMMGQSPRVKREGE